MKDIAKILTHYFTAVLFTEEDNDGDMDNGIAPGDFTVYNFSEDSKEKAEKDIKAFIELAGDKLEDWPEEQIGHDFWLTRCGHGAGFFDRDLPHAKELQELCKQFEFHGEVYAENGVVYIHG